jgi:Tfp pilus assembly protein PilF
MQRQLLFSRRQQVARIANYYQLLQVDPTAEQEVIQAAYRRLVLKYHPDTNKAVNAEERMKKINIAYETLRDPVKRAEYDQLRAAATRTPAQKYKTSGAATTEVKVPETAKPAAKGKAKPSGRRTTGILAAAAVLIAVAALIAVLSRQNQSPEVAPAVQGDAATHLTQGEQYLHDGKLSEAIAEFQAVVQLDPGSVEGHFRLGNTYFQQGQLDKATAEFQKTLELDSNNVDARSNLGAVYYQQGAFDKAAAEFKQAISLQPNDADIHYNLGAAYVQQYNYEAGITEFNEALRLSPELTRAYYGLGNAYKLQGKTQEAIQALEEFLSLSSASDEADLRPHAEALLAELKPE